MKRPNPSLKLAAAVGLWIAASPALSAASENETYTLYRSSASGIEMRVHVGTFDTDNGEAYNRENCQLAADLFQQQPGVQVRFWCEKGAFRR